MRGIVAKRLRKQAGGNKVDSYTEANTTVWGHLPYKKDKEGLPTLEVDKEKLSKALKDIKNPKFKRFNGVTCLRFANGVSRVISSGSRKHYKELKKVYC